MFCGFTLVLWLLPLVQRVSLNDVNVALVPRNIDLRSVNLFTTVSWEPGDGAPADQHYSVYYSGSYEKNNNESMLVIDDCNNTRETSCNLTSVLSIWAPYTVQVCAIILTGTACAPTKDITVLDDTLIDAPSIDHLDVLGNNIKVILSPLKLQEDGRAVFEHDAIYNITVCADIQEQQKCHYEESHTNSLNFENLEYNTEYCFTVQIFKKMYNKDKFSKVSEKKCQKTDKKRASNWEMLACFFVSLVIGFVMMFPLLILAWKLFEVARYVFAVDMPLPKTLCEFPSKQNGTFPLIIEKEGLKVNISTVEVLCDEVQEDYIVNGLGLQS